MSRIFNLPSRLPLAHATTANPAISVVAKARSFRFNQRAVVIGLAAACCLALTACDDTAADTQRKANTAQSVADEKIGTASREADAKIKAAQVEADKKIAEAEATFTKLRTDYRDTVKTALVTLDKKIDELTTKAKTATGKTKTDLDARLKVIVPSRDAFGVDYSALEKTTAPTWDTTKARIDKQLTELQAAVDKA